MNTEADPQRLLRQERAALEHELRRVRDALERNPGADFEREALRLGEAIALCDRDLARLDGGAR